MNYDVRLSLIYKKLLSRFGKQNWWPGDSALECALGAILTQNTSWVNAEKAISNLKSVMNINISNIDAISADELSHTIKPSGFYIRKAQSIKRLAELIKKEYGGDIEKMKDAETNFIREQLLSIKGIGPETADCILLYVLEKPAFVVDKYTYRILFRHGFVENDTTYESMQRLFMENLETDTEMFGEYHAQIVQVGKKYCKKRADCEDCPLNFDKHIFSNEII